MRLLEKLGLKLDALAQSVSNFNHSYDQTASGTIDFLDSIDGVVIYDAKQNDYVNMPKR